MSTITVILEADADGTLHLPLPAEFRHGKIEVTATLKMADAPIAKAPRATPDMLFKRREAFEKLRELNVFREIEDPAAWQREARKDRTLPGRE